MPPSSAPGGPLYLLCRVWSASSRRRLRAASTSQQLGASTPSPSPSRIDVSAVAQAAPYTLLSSLSSLFHLIWVTVHVSRITSSQPASCMASHDLTRPRPYNLGVYVARVFLQPRGTAPWAEFRHSLTGNRCGYETGGFAILIHATLGHPITACGTRTRNRQQQQGTRVVWRHPSSRGGDPFYVLRRCHIFVLSGLSAAVSKRGCGCPRCLRTASDMHAECS